MARMPQPSDSSLAMTPSAPHRPNRRLAAPALTLALAACALPSEHPVVWDGKSTPPVIEPMMVDGKCALMVSGSARSADLSIAQVVLTVERGLAQIDVHLGPTDQWTAHAFHVVVPVEEQHVSVIYMGATRYPVWERGQPGARDCAR